MVIHHQRLDVGGIRACWGGLSFPLAAAGGPSRCPGDAPVAETPAALFRSKSQELVADAFHPAQLPVLHGVARVPEPLDDIGAGQPGELHQLGVVFAFGPLAAQKVLL